MYCNTQDAGGGFGGIWDALRAAKAAAQAAAPPVAPVAPAPLNPPTSPIEHVQRLLNPVAPILVVKPDVIRIDDPRGPYVPPAPSSIPMPPGSTNAGTDGKGTVAAVTQQVTGWLQQPAVLIGLAVLGFLALRRSGGTRRY